MEKTQTEEFLERENLERYQGHRNKLYQQNTRNGRDAFIHRRYCRRSRSQRKCYILKKFLTQNIQKISNIMKIENLRIIGIEEGYFVSQNTTKYLQQNHRRKIS